MILIMLLACIASKDQQEACASVCERNGGTYDRCEEVRGGVRCSCLFLSPIKIERLDRAGGE